MCKNEFTFKNDFGNTDTVQKTVPRYTRLEKRSMNIDLKYKYQPIMKVALHCEANIFGSID